MTSDRVQRIVLVGGGHTHALVLHALKARPLRHAEITIINPGTTAPYSGMLPGFVAGHYGRAELDIDLQALAASLGATLLDARAVGLDPARRCFHLDTGAQVAFDIASIDVGITSEMKRLPGFAEFGVPAKPLANFATKWDAFRHSAGPKHVAIIGGGIAGAELAMAMAFALRNDPEDVTVRLLDRSQILSENSKTAQRRVRKALAQQGVTITEGAQVTAVSETGVVLNDAEHLPANFVVGAAGATPHGWIKDTGLALHDGFITVDPYLQTSLRNVFAVGDCAHMKHAPRPKAGVFAVRQAPVLTANLHHLMAGQGLQAFHPQADYLKLVSLGGKRAFGEKKGIGLSGRLMWRLKDKIDRDFMDQFKTP